MSAVIEFLKQKKRTHLSDDEAIVLLLIGQHSGSCRPRSLLESSGLPERSFWRAFATLGRQGWIDVTRAPSAGQGKGPGKFSACIITPHGLELCEILNMSAGNIPCGKRPPGVVEPGREQAE
jgi:hypothetical protein